ncbi:MAG: hypothetical protein JXA54_05565 [Candidatus Heimdallarchaeota archaeon]|nr:hypothetical protein [Candidatus Heimdallarchaeota archaeon]
MTKLRIIFNLLFLLFIFLFSTFISVKADITTDKPSKKIELVTRHRIYQGFDSHHCTVDKENKRLFISSDNNIKIFNISNPLELILLGEIPEKSYAMLKYYNDHIFLINYTYKGQYIRIYNVVDSNSPYLVGQSEPFDYATSEDSGVYLMYFPGNNLMFTCGASLRIWDISDLTNITCLTYFYYNEYFYDDHIEDVIKCKGLAFHPNEKYFLIAVGFWNGGDIFLINFEDPSNLVNINFDKASFVTNQSCIPYCPLNSLIGNGYYPCFTAGSQTLEVINWTNAIQPAYGRKIFLPERERLDHYPKLVLFDFNELLVYQILSGLIDVADYNNIKYLTECNTDRSIYTLYEPQFLDNYLIFLETDVIVQEGTFHYVTIMKINDVGNDKNNKLWLLTLTSLIPIIGLPILIKRKRLIANHN